MSNLALETKPVIVNQQTIFDHLPVAMLIADGNGVIHYFNHEAETLFSHDILSNTTVIQLSEQFKQYDFINAIESLNTRKQFKTHLNLKHKEGFYQFIMIKNPHIHITDNIEHDGKACYLFTLYPVKEGSSPVKEPLVCEKPAADKKPNHTSILKKNFKELKQFSRLSAMREISSSLADKLNQPLTAILSYTQAMQRLYLNNASSEEINNAMKRVVINAENAGKIIRKLRSQLNVNVLNYQITRINDLIQESIHLTDLDNPASQIKLVTQYEAEFTSLHIDKIQFRQVIFSLLNNAIDAVSDESVVSPEIVIKTQKATSHYKITISDNGPGLPEKIKSNLFEPFTTTKKNGIGIGLSMCRHIIDLHKGDISIQSNVQGMTIVTILIPLNTKNN